MGVNKSFQETLSDEAIVELYFARDERAIKETDKKYKKYLISIAYNILRDLSDSEECLNDTYIGAWNSIPPSRPHILMAFLATIIRRIALNRYKSDRRKKRVPPEMIDPITEFMEIGPAEEDIHKEIEDAELGRVINEYVGTLSKRKAYIFMSRYYYMRSIKEIAELTECSASTVNKELHAIKEGLKQKLESEGYSI